MKSHVVPEFLHRPLYDEKHRTLLFGWGASPPRLIQKGLREPLLCMQCEGKLQAHEDYFARYWYKRRPIPAQITDSDVLLDDVDYRSLKLLVLSIVWRAAVSCLPEFADVRLGKHEEPIRQMVHEGRAGGEFEYPIYGGLISDPETGSLWDGVMLQPMRIKVRSHWAVRMVFAGVSWTVLTSSHQTLPLDGYFLSENGLRLPTLSAAEFTRVTGLVDAARNSQPLENPS